MRTKKTFPVGVSIRSALLKHRNKRVIMRIWRPTQHELDTVYDAKVHGCLQVGYVKHVVVTLNPFATSMSDVPPEDQRLLNDTERQLLEDYFQGRQEYAEQVRRLRAKIRPVETLEAFKDLTDWAQLYKTGDGDEEMLFYHRELVRAMAREFGPAKVISLSAPAVVEGLRTNEIPPDEAFRIWDAMTTMLDAMGVTVSAYNKICRIRGVDPNANFL